MALNRTFPSSLGIRPAKRKSQAKKNSFGFELKMFCNQRGCLQRGARRRSGGRWLITKHGTSSLWDVRKAFVRNLNPETCFQCGGRWGRKAPDRHLRGVDPQDRKGLSSCRCRANLEPISQSRPDCGLGLSHDQSESLGNNLSFIARSPAAFVSALDTTTPSISFRRRGEGGAFIIRT